MSNTRDTFTDGEADMDIRRSGSLILMLLVLNGGAAGAPATTWVPVEVECPVCHTKNSFLTWASYGSYIYQWPSKYQLIFWPYTESPVLYSCKKCRLTAFLEDFKEVPAGKLPVLSKILREVSLPSEDAYTKIPMSERLRVAEKVYEALGRDDEFWSHFHRVVGYHMEEEKKQKEADEARRKALGIVERMLANKESAGVRKELLYVSGAMRFFLKDRDGALKDFNEASGLKYRNDKYKPEQSENVDKYLSSLLAEYVKVLQEGKAPQNRLASLGRGPRPY